MHIYTLSSITHITTCVCATTHLFYTYLYKIIWDFTILLIYCQSLRVHFWVQTTGNHQITPAHLQHIAWQGLSELLLQTQNNTHNNTHPLSKHLSAPVQYISLIVTVNGLKLLLALRCISNNENTTTRKREPFKRGLYDAHVILHTLLKNSRTGWLDLSNGAYPLLIK